MNLSRIISLWVAGFILGSSLAHARPHYYPPVRFQGLSSSAMGGVTLPISNEIANSLFNNPAGLARNTKFRAEYLNLNLEANSGLLGELGLDTLQATSLSGLTSQLNSNSGRAFGAGFANASAVQWGGLGVGVLFQRLGIASSDGSTIQYYARSQFIPVIGYGVALARGVVRLGYSAQWVNQAYGLATTTATDSGASFLKGLNEGRGLSHQASVNFVFPFTYIPTFSILARNIGGTHYVGGSALTGATESVRITPDEPMSIDVAFNYMVRLGGKVKSQFYFQYRDVTSAYALPFLERMSLGVELGVSNAVLIRGGMMGAIPSLGLAYSGKGSEFGLYWFKEPNPIPTGADRDSRFGLQYKIFFQSENTRDQSGQEN